MVTGDETWLYLFSKPRPEGHRQQICKLGFQSKDGLFSALLNYQGRADLEMAVIMKLTWQLKQTDKLRTEKGGMFDRRRVAAKRPQQRGMIMEIAMIMLMMVVLEVTRISVNIMCRTSDDKP